MKKKIICLISAVCAVFSLILAGCNAPTEKYDSSISEIRDAVYEGRGGSFSVTAVSGVHEDPFSPDGTAGKKREFTVITLKPDEFMPGSLYTYAVTVDGKEFGGVMTMHPFGETYSVELDKRTHEETLSLDIKLGSSDETVELRSVAEEGDIDADHALDTALTAMKDELESIKSGNSFACEIYVRLIANPINTDGGYYWYVAFVESDGTRAVLIDRKSAEVVGVKNK